MRGGFAFEYSATFGQAVAKGMTVAAAEEDIQKRRAKLLFNTTILRSLDDGQKAQLALTADDKRRARLNCISHLLGKVPYEAIHYEPITLPPIKTADDYHQTHVLAPFPGLLHGSLR